MDVRMKIFAYTCAELVPIKQTTKHQKLNMSITARRRAVELKSEWSLPYRVRFNNNSQLYNLSAFETNREI
jgi:hypothetical protein